MTDTNITLAASSAGVSGAQTITASAALFAATDVGRALAIRTVAPIRAAATVYSVGAVFYSEYNQVDRVYRVTSAGTTAAANMAGTTPNYDQNAPRDAGVAITDGSCVLRYLGSGKQAWGFGIITAFIDTTHVTVTVDPQGPFPSTTASLLWRLGEWNATRGYPRAVTFHQQRTVWASSIKKPQALWFSQSGDFANMGPDEPDGTVLDTDAITISVDDDQVNEIVWLSSVPRGLVAGVTSGEFLVGPASTVSLALAPNNIRAVRQGDRGSTGIAGMRVSGVVLFVQRGGRKLRELQYDFGSDTFTTQDLSKLADHIAGPGIVEAAYQELQEGTLWLVRSDGVLVSLTYDREEKVRAWCRHILGGTNAKVESVCCVPSPDGTGDDVYLAVVRTVGGVTRRTMEYLTIPYRADIDGDAGGFFVDSGMTYSGTPAGTFSGLGHLEGETVTICADGAARPPQVVTGGQVSIDLPAASLVHIGLPFTSQITLLSPQVEDPRGVSQGRYKHITHVFLRFLETRGGKIGTTETGYEILEMRPNTANLSQAVPLFTGDHRVLYPGGTDRNAQMTILQDQPLPMTLLAVMPDVNVVGG